jgi:hypothetical protein
MPRFISLTTEDFPTMLLQMEVHLAMRQARPESFITKSGELHVEYLGDEDGDEYALRLVRETVMCSSVTSMVSESTRGGC